MILVPGLFGLGRFHELPYFAHVRRVLADGLPRRGLDAHIRKIPAPRATSLEGRARLLAAAVEAACPGTGPIHLIGHSSGGLDARRVAAVAQPRLADRVRTVVTVATPHRGTPLASALGGVFGRRLLQATSVVLAYSVRFGRVPLGLAGRLLMALGRVDDILRFRRTILDELYDQFLADFGDDRGRAVREFVQEAGDQQSFIAQLTPRAMSVLDEAMNDRGGIRYGSVLTWGRRPELSTMIQVGTEPYGQLSHALYGLLHRLSIRYERDLRPVIDIRDRVAYLRYYPRLPDRRASDGLVPTLSQLHGELVFAARADHLDILGHYADPDPSSSHHDWLASGSPFGRRDFVRAWDAVMDFLCADLGAG